VDATSVAAAVGAIAELPIPTGGAILHITEKRLGLDGATLIKNRCGGRPIALRAGIGGDRAIEGDLL